MTDQEIELIKDGLLQDSINIDELTTIDNIENTDVVIPSIMGDSLVNITPKSITNVVEKTILNGNTFNNKLSSIVDDYTTTAVNTKIGAINTNIQSIQSNISGINRTINQVNLDITELGENLTEVKTTTDSAAADVTKLNTEVKTASNKVEALTTTVDTVSRVADAANTLSQSNAGRLTTAERTLGDINRQLEDITGSDNVYQVSLRKDSNLQYTLLVNNVDAGKINIPKDQFLKSVNYDGSTHILTFTFNTTDGETISTIDISDLVDVYTAGRGVQITDGTINVLVKSNDNTYTNYISLINDNGVYKLGTNNALKSVLEGLDSDKLNSNDFNSFTREYETFQQQYTTHKNKFDALETNYNTFKGEYTTIQEALNSIDTMPETIPASIVTGLSTVATSGSYNDLSNTPTIPESLPASDVHEWAKAASKPSYTWSEINSKPSEFNPTAHTHEWDEVNSKPSTFTPSSHNHQTADITDFPTSLPASDVKPWAKADNKPTYSASEIQDLESTYALKTELPNANPSKPYETFSYVKSTGIMEVGKCLDFHFTNGAYDYSTRLYCTGNHTNVVNLPEESGTLALKSDMPSVDTKADLDSPALIGTPTAPTAILGTNNTQLATTEFVNSVVNSKIAAADAMIYKGTLGTNGTITQLPAVHSIGWTYKVISSGTYAGQNCEIGDMVVCLDDGQTKDNSHWTVIQSNIDGAVIGPKTSVTDEVVVFSNTTGKSIKSSGYKIESNVPADAKFTDTTYNVVTTTSDGLMSAVDKQLLDGVCSELPNKLSQVELRVGLDSYTSDSGVITIPAYPTTLPASDVYGWAKTQSKPAYNTEEIVGFNDFKNRLSTVAFSGNYNDLNNIPIIEIPEIELPTWVTEEKPIYDISEITFNNAINNAIDFNIEKGLLGYGIMETQGLPPFIVDYLIDASKPCININDGNFIKVVDLEFDGIYPPGYDSDEDRKDFEEQMQEIASQFKGCVIGNPSKVLVLDSAFFDIRISTTSELTGLDCQHYLFNSGGITNFYRDSDGTLHNRTFVSIENFSNSDSCGAIIHSMTLGYMQEISGGNEAYKAWKYLLENYECLENNSVEINSSLLGLGNSKLSKKNLIYWTVNGGTNTLELKTFTDVNEKHIIVYNDNSTTATINYSILTSDKADGVFRDMDAQVTTLEGYKYLEISIVKTSGNHYLIRYGEEEG